MTKRRNWSAEEKVEIVLAGIKGDKSIAQICRDNNISQSTYYSWRDKFLDAAKSAFRNGTTSNEKALKSKIEDLEKIIGKITVENEILKKTEEMIKTNGDE